MAGAGRLRRLRNRRIVTYDPDQPAKSQRQEVAEWRDALREALAQRDAARHALRAAIERADRAERQVAGLLKAAANLTAR